MKKIIELEVFLPVNMYIKDKRGKLVILSGEGRQVGELRVPRAITSGTFCVLMFLRYQNEYFKLLFVLFIWFLIPFNDMEMSLV